MLNNYVFTAELLINLPKKKHSSIYKKVKSRYKHQKIGKHVFIDISSLEREYQVIAYTKCTNLTNLIPASKVVDLFSLSKDYIGNLYSKQSKRSSNILEKHPLRIIKINKTLFINFEHKIIKSIDSQTCFRIENREDHNYAIQENMTILSFGYTKIGFY